MRGLDTPSMDGSRDEEVYGEFGSDSSGKRCRIRAQRAVHVNAALRQAGLIDVDGKGAVSAWRAPAWTAGGSAAIVLRDPSDQETLARARTGVREMAADPAAPVDRIIEPADVAAIDMRDVAPTLAAQLGVALPRAQGRNRL